MTNVSDQRSSRGEMLRIAVMFRGKIIDILDRDQSTKEGVGLLMAGVHPDTVAASARAAAEPPVNPAMD